MDNYQFYDPNNVNWKFTKCIQCTPGELNRIMDVLERHGYERTEPDPGKRVITAHHKLYRKYFLASMTPYDVTLHVTLMTEYVYLPIRYTTRHKLADENTVRASEAAPHIFRLFKKHNAGVGFPEVFGNDDGMDELPLWIKSCVPSPLNYAYPELSNMYISGCFKGDVSAAYPYEATKPLPTLRGAKLVKGHIKASKEWPFAFNPHRGTVDIYGEFCSDYFFDREEYKYKQLKTPPIDEDMTILCKAAPSNPLGDIFYTKYKNRNKFPRNKSCMNTFIGFCHMNNRPTYSHIPAVIIARCNHRMFKLADSVRARGQIPVLLNVDSLMWAGTDQPDLMSESKGFGVFRREHDNAMAYVCSAKKYQIMDADGTLTTTWSGKKTHEQNEVPFGGIQYTSKTESYFLFDEDVGRFKIIYRDEFGFETDGGIA